jgi:hypothetical protein
VALRHANCTSCGTLQLATAIAANGALAVAASKRIIQESAPCPAERAFEQQGETAAPVFASADAHEGAKAFIEKAAGRLAESMTKGAEGCPRVAKGLPKIYGGGYWSDQATLSRQEASLGERRAVRPDRIPR